MGRGVFGFVNWKAVGAAIKCFMLRPDTVSPWS